LTVVERRRRETQKMNFEGKKKPKWFHQLNNYSCECKHQFYFNKDLYKHSISCSNSNNRGIICLSSGELVIKCQEGVFRGHSFPLKDLPTISFVNGLKGTVKKNVVTNKFYIEVSSEVYNVHIDISVDMIILFIEIGYWV
jgi:hypothetical protein